MDVKLDIRLLVDVRVLKNPGVKEVGDLRNLTWSVHDWNLVDDSQGKGLSRSLLARGLVLGKAADLWLGGWHLLHCLITSVGLGLLGGNSTSLWLGLNRISLGHSLYIHIGLRVVALVAHTPGSLLLLNFDFMLSHNIV